MKIELTTALALVLAMSAAPTLAQDTSTSGGTTTTTQSGANSGDGGATTQSGTSTSAGATTTGTDAGSTSTQVDSTAADSASTGAQTDPTVSTSVGISVEQQTEIRQVITEVNVDPVVDVDFNISVGTAVPQTIALQPLPPRIIQIMPDYEGYLFFLLADGRVVIVAPDSLQIVYVLNA